MPNETLTHVGFASKDGVKSRDQFKSSIGLDDVAECPSFESCLDDIGGRFLTHEQNFGVGRKASDLSRGFDSIQPGKTDVQQNQFWLEIPSLLNCFQAIC